jgi:hypothetical protein
LNELQQKDSTLRTATMALQKRDGEAAGIHASLESLEEELNFLRNENDIINRKSKEDKNKSRELEKEIVSLGTALERVKGEGEAMKVSIKDLALVPILSSNVEGASIPTANGYKDSDTCILALKEILTWLELKKKHSLNTDNAFLSPIKTSNDGLTIHLSYGGSSSNNSGSKMNYSASMVGFSIGEESIRELISRVKEGLEDFIGDIERKITTQQVVNMHLYTHVESYRYVIYICSRKFKCFSKYEWILKYIMYAQCMHILVDAYVHLYT